jgi:predicted XRE-type DNA-binding protein
MARHPIRVEKSSGNVFLDIGFDEAEAAELLAKAKLSLELQRAVRARGLTQKQAAALCRTDQPTLSKVLNGRMTSISMDQLTRWLNALGRSVEITVKRARGPATTVVVGA